VTSVSMRSPSSRAATLRDAVDRFARGPIPWRAGVAVMIAAGGLSGGGLGHVLPDLAWDLLIFAPAALLTLVLWVATPGTPAAPWRPAGIAFAALVLAAAVSSLTSSDPPRVLAQSGILALMGAFLLGTWRTRWTGRGRLAADLVPAVAAVSVLVGLSLLLGSLGIGWAFGDNERLAGVYSNPNGLGMMAAFVILVLLVVAHDARAAHRVILLVATVPLLAVLVWSGSRGAALGLLVGALVAMIARRAWWWLVGVVSAAIAVSVGVLVGAPWLLDRAQYGDITSGRITLYLELLERWAESPVLGIGYRLADTANRFELPAHNILLGVLVETGVLGFAAFVALLVLLFRAGRAGPWLGPVVGILVYEQTESSLFGWGGPTAVAFWLVLVAHAAYRTASPERAPSGWR
jgi:O-antigen ligase